MNNAPTTMLLALVMAAPLAAQQNPALGAGMPPGYVQEMPSPERILTDIRGSDSIDIRARQSAAMLFLWQVMMLAPGNREFNTGLTPDEARLRRGYYDAGTRLSYGSNLVPGLDSLVGVYMSDTSPLRTEILERYFSPAWRAGWRVLEAADRQRDLAREAANAPRAAAPATPLATTGWVKVWPGRDNPTGPVVAFAVTPTRLVARVVSVGLLESTDSGATWTSGGSLNNDGFGYPLAVIGEEVWATSTGHVVRGANDPTIWTTTTDGAQWVTSLAVVNTTLFAASQRHGLLVSSDRGLTWTQPVMPGDPERGRSVPVISALAASGPTLFIAAVGHGLFRTNDDGATWTAMNAGLTGFTRQVRYIAASAGQVYVDAGLGVFVSTRTGRTWSPFVEVTNGLSGASLRRFAFDEAGNVFATSQDGLVFFRSNRGGDWRAVSAGLPREAYNMDAHARPLFVLGPFLYVGNDRGVWRRRIQEMRTAPPSAAPAQRRRP